MEPPESIYIETGEYGISTDGESADLRNSLWAMRPQGQSGNNSFYLGDLNDAFTPIGEIEGTHTSVAGTPDLSHIVLGTSSGLGEYVGTGNQGAPQAVSVDNTGAPTPGLSCFDQISSDGRVIVYTAVPNNCGFHVALWARVGESASVAVSGSECTRTSGDPGGACNAPAEVNFAGAAADGSRVFFTTTQQLVNGDTDQTNDLYECDIPPGIPAPIGTANTCASLTAVSHNVTGANVENVVKVSEDGSRVYFVAQGVLAANLGSNDAAAVGGDNNLYVWEKDAAHPAGQTTFVAKLESNDIGAAQSTVDGRYLVFNTANKLLASDTDETTDVYRYDANTGILLRLSTDTNGNGGNEPGAEAKLTIASPAWRPHYAMTDDVSTVVFETTEALSPADTDGVTDVYEWHEGHVSLISSGGGNTPWITSSGKDIFFRTTVPLTAGDSGTEEDIYDARVEGGFPVSAPAPCSGEACQGPTPLQPQPPGASASAAFNGPGSPLAGETPPATPKPYPATPAQKLAKTLKACRAKHGKKKRTACEKRARNTYRRAK
ncbi:MAG TPA: hypothetical protein VK537_07350 [Galbitalea sp.]|nr:hypothetical protein [Galbitalea sp.]